MTVLPTTAKYPWNLIYLHNHTKNNYDFTNNVSNICSNIANLMLEWCILLEASLVQEIHNILVRKILSHKTQLTIEQNLKNYLFLSTSNERTSLTFLPRLRQNRDMATAPTSTLSLRWNVCEAHKFNHVVIQNTITTHTWACVIIFLVSNTNTTKPYALWYCLVSGVNNRLYFQI